MSSVWSWIGDVWCRLTHPAPMWPINGYYICPKCQAKYPVLWEQAAPTAAETAYPDRSSEVARESRQVAMNVKQAA